MAAPTQSKKRSIVKAIIYRVIILCLDFITVRIISGRSEVAIGFTIISNVYTTISYFIYERAWERIKWGLNPG